MANDRVAEQKRTSEEEEVNEILRESLQTLRSDVQSLNKAINFNEDNPRKLAMLINARAKIQQQIYYCIALMRDPKLKLTSDSGRSRDFARLIQKALLEENPAVARMVQEANKS
ncbi:MAG: hypothetical protein ACYCPW_07265 [Nitrososphaerales archaeon]